MVTDSRAGAIHPELTTATWGSSRWSKRHPGSVVLSTSRVVDRVVRRPDNRRWIRGDGHLTEAAVGDEDIDTRRGELAGILHTVAVAS